MLGFFGNIVFETSDNRILNFTGFTRDVSSRFAAHEVIGQKPKTEYIGPGLDTITFTINLNGNHGIKPRDEMDKWVSLTRNGEAHILVIGDKGIGTDKWVVKNVSQTWDVIFNNGELFSGKIDVALEEYISWM